MCDVGRQSTCEEFKINRNYTKKQRRKNPLNNSCSTIRCAWPNVVRSRLSFSHIMFNWISTPGDARQGPTLRGLTGREYKEENSTSACRLWHRSKTNTTSKRLRYCRRESPRSVAGNGGSSGSNVYMVGWLCQSMFPIFRAFEKQIPRDFLTIVIKKTTFLMRSTSWIFTVFAQ